MNILYFIPNITIAGGISRIVFDKINYLINHTNYNIYVCYYGNGNEKAIYGLDSRVHVISINVDSLNHNLFTRCINVIRNIFIIKKILTSNNIDIAINANAPLLIWILPFICKKIAKIHEFHFSYDGQVIWDQTKIKNKIIRSFIIKARKYALARYDIVVALTEIDKRKWGLHNSIVIPNFSNIHLQDISTKKEKIVVSVGRLEPVKGYDLLIRAWSQVHLKHPDWKLHIWGEGSLKTSLIELINKLKLNNSVFLMGYTSDIEIAYKEASIYIMTSQFEGFPLVLIEAMQWGLPCVSVKISGAEAIIENGKNGILIEERNECSIAEQICFLIENPNLIKEMGEKAMESTKRFSKERIMQKWINLINSLTH